MVLPTDSRQHLKKVSSQELSSHLVHSHYMKVDEILNLVNHELGIEHDQLHNDDSKV